MDSNELKTALKNMQHLRAQREQKIRKADRLEEKLDSVGVSGIYNENTGRTNNRHAPQELLEEIIDLRRSAFNDLDLLADVEMVLEPEIDKIKDYDLRVILKYIYFSGISVEDTSAMFSESEPDYVYKVLDRFFDGDN